MCGDRLKPPELSIKGCFDQSTPGVSCIHAGCPAEQTLRLPQGEGETGMLAAKHGESVSIRTFHPPLTQGDGPFHPR